MRPLSLGLKQEAWRFVDYRFEVGVTDNGGGNSEGVKESIERDFSKTDSHGSHMI